MSELLRSALDPHLKMSKPPDKKKHEATIAELMAAIDAKQKEKRSLGPGDMSAEQLRALRGEKDTAFRKRREIEAELNAFTQEIRKKNNELTKVQSNLQGYRSEARIDEAIRKLEFQLRMNNFRLSDERKMVSEIDSLKRSKKVLFVVNSMKKEIGTMKDRQRQLRENRDCYFKKYNEIKQKEEAHKRKAQSDKARHEELKKEIDALYEEKRSIVSHFKAQEKEFREYREGMRLKQKHVEYLQREEKRLAYEQELAEYEASREPYQDEKQLCTTLLAYLQSLMPTCSSQLEMSQESEESERAASSGHDSDTLAQSFESEGLYLLKKKQEDLFSGIKPKTQRRSKKDKKRVLTNKKMTHSPQTLQQFAEIGVKAPATLQDVHETMQQVESKKLHYECLPPPQLIIPQPRHFVDGLPSDEKSSAGTPSVTESAIAESIPSTPEVYQGDAAGNPFLRGGADGSGAVAGSSPLSWRQHQRKLSHDSGACELEEEDEQKTPDCDEKFHLQNPLHSVENSMENSAHQKSAAAVGDFPPSWKSGELSRRTLSTVSSQSDKDSSASSDTIVDSPQNKSCDDLKIETSRDFLSLGSDWPALSRETSIGSQKSPTTCKEDIERHPFHQDLKLNVDIATSHGIDMKTSSVVVPPVVHSHLETAAQSISPKAAGDSSLDRTDLQASFPLAETVNVESQSEDSLQMAAGATNQSYASFQTVVPTDQSCDSTQKLTQGHDPVVTSLGNDDLGVASLSKLCQNVVSTESVS